MRVALTGASGFIGSRLAAELAARGETVVRLVRRAARGRDEVVWDPDRGLLDPAALAGVGAVVHLAGANLGDGRWSPARKREILQSRVRGTELLARTLASMPQPPPVLVCASAVGYYGDRGPERVDEQSAAGSGFLAGVCRAWEEAAAPAAARGLRVTHLRLGLVLARDGGGLPQLMRPFLIGVGGSLGSGRQFLPWIALDDACEIFLRALTEANWRGAINVVAPQLVTNGEFARSLGRVLRRPAMLPAPAWALRLLMGEMAQEMLLAGQAVRPRRLQEAGFRFRHPELEGALRFVLGRK